MNIILPVSRRIPFLVSCKSYQTVRIGSVKSCVNIWFSKERSVMGVTLGTLSKCCFSLKNEEAPLLIEKSVTGAERRNDPNVLTTETYPSSSATHNEALVNAEQKTVQDNCSETDNSQFNINYAESENAPNDTGIKLSSSQKTVISSKRLHPSNVASEKQPQLTEENGTEHVELSFAASCLSPKKKRRRTKRGSRLPGQTATTAGIKEKKIRPNYFVAFKVSNPEIHHHVDVIQQHMLSQDPRLHKCLIKLSTLHITLMVMHLENDEEISRALGALKAAHRTYNEEMSTNPLVLEFKGLSHFSNKVLFADISPGCSLDRLISFVGNVRKYFQDADINSTEGDKDFNPHLTIMKLSKDTSLRAQKVYRIDPSLYTVYQDTFFGNQTVEGIELLCMNQPLKESGYYYGTELFFGSAQQ